MKWAVYKTFALLYLMIVTFCLFFVGIFQNYIHANIWLVVLAVFLAAIPVAVLVLKLLLKRQMSKPGARLHKEFMDELWKNGYTQRFFELGEQAINEHKNGQTIDLAYLMDFVLYQCDYFNLIDRYDVVFSLLSLLDKKEIASKSTRFLDGGYYIVMYYATCMEACRGTGNKVLAQQIIEEGKPFLDKQYKMEVLSMVADATVYTYYILNGNYEMARKCVDKIMSYRSVQAQKFFTKYYIAAEMNMILGNRTGAIEMLEQGKRIVGDGSALINQVFELYKAKLRING